MTTAEFEQIREVLSSVVPFNTHVGVRVDEVGAGVARTSLVQSSPLANHVGTLHAGALFTLAEAASGAAIVGLLGSRISEITPLARGAQIRYLKPARDEIGADATLTEPGDALIDRLDRDGKTDTTVDVALTDASGTAVARMQVEWHLRVNPRG